MANQKNQAGSTFVRPSGLANLAAKYPVYFGGDARIVKVGTKAAPIHGYFLGSVNLPSTQKDQKTGELKPWVGFIIELLQPAPATPSDKDAEGNDLPARMYGKGERIILTMNKVLETYRNVGEHPGLVFEIYCEPEVGRNKDNQPMWIYPTFECGKPRARVPATDNVNLLGIQLGRAIEPALGAGTNGAAPQLGAGSDLPVT